MLIPLEKSRGHSLAAFSYYGGNQENSATCHGGKTVIKCKRSKKAKGDSR